MVCSLILLIFERDQAFDELRESEYAKGNDFSF